MMTNLKWAAVAALIAAAMGETTASETPDLSYCDAGSFTTDMTKDPLPCRGNKPDITKMKWWYFNEAEGDEWVSLPPNSSGKLYLDESSNKHKAFVGTYDTVSDALADKWDASSTVKLLIKGFNVDPRKDARLLVQEYLKKYRNQGLNVLVADASDGLFKNSLDVLGYHAPAKNTQIVGWQIAKVFERLIELNKIQSAPTTDSRKWDIHCTGHSLGAQTCGRFGRSLEALTLKKIARITALDAAHPRFSRKTGSSSGDDLLAQFSINKNDAELVEGVHTNNNLEAETDHHWLSNVIQYQGLATPYGHVDYYINGGYIQPGCALTTGGSLWGRDPNDKKLLGCSHNRAHKLWAAVINNPITEMDQCETADPTNPDADEYGLCMCFPTECNDLAHWNAREAVPSEIFGDGMPARNGLYFVYTSDDQENNFSPDPRAISPETGLTLQLKQEFYDSWQTPGVFLGNPGELGLIYGSFTAMAWVKQQKKYASGNIFTGTDYTIFGASGGATNDGEMRLVIRDGKYAMVWEDTKGGRRELLQECRTELKSENPREGLPFNPKNLWKHVAFVYDIERTEARIYVDGELGQTCTGISPWAVLGSPAVAVARLGYWPDPSADANWKGYIRDTKIYNKALTAEAINESKGPCKGIACPAVARAVEDRCDRNGDGQISPSEARYCMADKNGDGRVDAQDSVRRLDFNGDGETTFLEMAFADADEDGSGALDSEEFMEVFLAEMPELVTDRDMEVAGQSVPATTPEEPAPTPSEPAPTPTSDLGLINCSDYTTEATCQAAGTTESRRRLKTEIQCMWKEATDEVRRRLKAGSCVEKPKPVCSDYTTKETCEAAGATESRRRLKPESQCMWKEASDERRRLKAGSCVDKSALQDSDDDLELLRSILQPESSDSNLVSRVNAVIALVVINTIFLIGMVVYVVIKQY